MSFKSPPTASHGWYLSPLPQRKQWSSSPQGIPLPPEAHTRSLPPARVPPHGLVSSTSNSLRSLSLINTNHGHKNMSSPCQESSQFPLCFSSEPDRGILSSYTGITTPPFLKPGHSFFILLLLIFYKFLNINFMPQILGHILSYESSLTLFWVLHP